MCECESEERDKEEGGERKEGKVLGVAVGKEMERCYEY